MARKVQTTRITERKKKISTKGMFQPGTPQDEIGIFAPTVGGRLANAEGGVDSLKHDLDLLAMERAIMYPSYSVGAFLEEMKGYSVGQINRIFKHKPASEWEAAKDQVMDKITENVVKRHIDQLAEVNEQHIKASKLTMARAVEMLTKLPVSSRTEYDYEPDGVTVRRDPVTNKPMRKMTLRSVDLMNCSSAIKSAQEIYRKAMGLNNDDGGIQQILDKVTQLSQINNVQNNVTINMQQTPLEQALSQMSYEQISELIEMKRDKDFKSEPDDTEIEQHG